MNFQESKKIEDVIKSSKNILLALHQSPDPDSIVSNLLVARYLDKFDKKYKIVCFDSIPEKFKKTYDTVGLIEDSLNPLIFDFGEYDLFIALDVNQPIRFGLSDDIKFRNIINIDHHGTQNTFEGLKINDSSYSSATEILYYFFEDLDYRFNSEEADLILLGIVTDTDGFSYAGDSRVFQTVSSCIKLGGNYEKINEIIYRNNSLDQLKFWADALKKIKVDEKYEFAYVSIDLNTFKRYPNILQATRTLADKFVRSIENIKFGLVMTETDEGYLKISVRARSNDYNVMPLLKDLNGGGHLSGGGGRMDLPYKEAVKETLRLCREFVKKRRKNIV